MIFKLYSLIKGYWAPWVPLTPASIGPGPGASVAPVCPPPRLLLTALRFESERFRVWGLGFPAIPQRFRHSRGLMSVGPGL